MYDLHAASVELREFWRGLSSYVLDEEHDVVRPLSYEKRMLYSILSVPRTPDGLIAYLPAMAVRAVQEVAAPSLLHPGDVGELVGDTGGEQ